MKSLRGPALLAALLAGLSSAPGRAAEPDDAVGRVNWAGVNRSEMCSGVLVRPDRVLTAAHCVLDDAMRPRPTGSLVFVAGWTGTGHAAAARVVRAETHPGALRGGEIDVVHDIAVLTLEAALDVTPLAVGLAGPSGPYTLLGYRRSRPHALSVTEACDGGRAGPLLRLGCGIEAGQSGGPVIFGSGTARRVVGVLSAMAGDDALAVPVDGWTRAALSR